MVFGDILILMLIIGGVVWKRYSLARFFSKRSAKDSANDTSSEIISYYVAGHDLLNVSHGKQGGLRYSLYMTAPRARQAEEGVSYVDGEALIYSLDLPFNTETHVVGLSKTYGIDRLKFASFLQANGLEKVVLEGDFPDYFDLYATPGQQFQVRYVLNPKAMVFVVDYCRSHFWEINGSTLFCVAGEKDREDTSIIDQSQLFVEHIKPALLPGDPGASVVHHDMPYGEYDGPALLCPICNKPMTVTDSWQACPDGQGVLVMGRDLLRMLNRDLQITELLGKATDHGPLTCPHCHNPLVDVNYEATGIHIDSCETCPFRWLDAGEATALANKSRAKLNANSDVN